MLERVSPLIKLVKDREQLYFELLSFVTAHITADSNDLDTLTIFAPFLARIRTHNDALLLREQTLLLALQGHEVVPMEPIARYCQQDTGRCCVCRLAWWNCSRHRRGGCGGRCSSRAEWVARWFV